MRHFIIMFICILLGQLIRRIGGFRISQVRPLNLFILWISLPAVIFVEVPSLFRETSLSRPLALAIMMPWLEFFTAAGLLFFVGRRLRWSRGVLGALTLTAGLGNTSFVGFPVIEFLFGEPGIKIAILIDQLGTFFILGTLGLVTASLCAGRELKIREVLRRILFFPTFLSFFLAVLWGLSRFPVQGPPIGVLKIIGSTLVPLALISVGWQLEASRLLLKQYSSKLGLGLGFKLLLWPLLTFTLFYPLMGPKNLIYQVTLMEAAMAPMITGAVMATEFGLEPELAQLMVGLGIPLSLFTLLFWKIVL